MNLLTEIKSKFAETSPGTALKLSSLPDLFPAWVIRTKEWFGICVPYESNTKISEHFSEAKLWSDTYSLHGKFHNLLILASSNERYRQEFAVICSQFVEPGVNGQARQSLLNNPLNWWDNWKKLIGNAIVDKQPYAVLSELYSLNYLLNAGERDLSWGGANRSSYDITTINKAWEIKSTTSRYENIVKISSHHQLEIVSPTTLYLIFFRFEENASGISLNNMVDLLIANGYDRTSLEKDLTRLGYEDGCSARNIPYIIHEIKRFLVDEHFPKITASMFIGGIIPTPIKKISYEIDLTSMECDALEIFYK